MSYNCTFKRSPCKYTKQNVPTLEVTQSVSIIVIRVSAIANSVTTRPYYRQKLSRALLIFKSSRPKDFLTNRFYSR